MTVSVVWRDDRGINLASDSRISFLNAGHADVGIKVLSVAVSVIGAEGTPDKPNILLEKRFGFCYAGNLVAGATFKAFIEELLGKVQYVGPIDRFSFISVCDFVSRYCGHMSTELNARLFESGEWGFILAGYCPLQRRLRASVFSFTQADGAATASYEEVAIEVGDIHCIGSGAGSLYDTIDAGETHTLLALNRVIDDEAVPSVGGDIQYGAFDSKLDFNVYGVNRISQERYQRGEIDSGDTEMRLFRLRGFDLFDNFDPENQPFWPLTPVIELHVPSNAFSHQVFQERYLRRHFVRGTGGF